MNRIEDKLREVAAGGAASSSKIQDMLWNFGRWLNDEDEYSDVIISSRIRLARNIKGFPFPHKASDTELAKILEKARHACSKCKSLSSARYLDIRKLSDWDCKYFVERRLASPQFVESERPSLLVVGPQENISVMVNEEDHLRIQCIEAGLGVKEAWRKVRTLDDELEDNLNFSFSNKFGYLTACPTNIGTGMRVSAFVHLPGLSMKEEIESFMRKLPSSEVAVRGFYGEGTESIGSIFQISNQLTLGRTEENVISRMLQTAKELIARERDARDKLLKSDRIRIEDTVYRALGILQNARIISSLEAIKLLSTLRFGRELGLIEDFSRIALNQLMVLVQPAHLQKIYNRDMNAEERDIFRAEFIRQNLEI
ncbi:MAG: protein arginine kinase [Calditrichaeota bacterium]|nr:MAG: protein arginine kinase [Calditrichota bacterium]